MSVLRMTGAVRQAFGPNAAALSAGVGVPDAAECWGCRGTVDLVRARAGTVCLSAVVVGPVSVSAFSHRGCGDSQVFTGEEFAVAAGQAQPSGGAGSGRSDRPVPWAKRSGDEALLIDGQRLA